MRKIIFLVIIAIFLLSGVLHTRNAEASTLIVNPNQVYSYSKMVSDIQKLKAAYPDLINVKVIGKSEYGRNLYAVSLGHGPAQVFINGSHHAREWLTTNLNMYMLNQYAESYERNGKIDGYDARSILNGATIWFVPMVNPDGVTLQQQGLDAFSKSAQASLVRMNGGSTNFKRWKANAKGIDLNRQYPADWRYIKNSPKGPSYKDFKGNAPESAAETKAIVKFANEINPEMALSYHSSGKILYWNYKQDKTRYSRDKVYANQLSKFTGYKLINPGPNPSGGGFTDWFILTKKRPAFALEIAKPVDETNPPISEFPSVWRENQEVGLYIANESIKLYNERIAVGLQANYQNLDKSAMKLRTFYFTTIKTKDNVKIDVNFTSLYNQVKADKLKLDTQTAKMPSAYRKKLEALQKDIQLYLTNSANFIDGVTAGKGLLPLQNSLTNKLQNGSLDNDTLALQKQLIDQTHDAAVKIGKIYSSDVRKLVSAKFTLPAQITKENTIYELSRYQLTMTIENLLASNNVDTAKQKFAELEQMEELQAKGKQKGNLLYPGQYYTFPKTEKWLLEQKIAIQEKLIASVAL